MLCYAAFTPKAAGRRVSIQSQRIDAFQAHVAWNASIRCHRVCQRVNAFGVNAALHSRWPNMKDQLTDALLCRVHTESGGAARLHTKAAFTAKAAGGAPPYKVNV